MSIVLHTPILYTCIGDEMTSKYTMKPNTCTK